MRVIYFINLHRDVLETDDHLERLAFNMLYMETAKDYLDWVTIAFAFIAVFMILLANAVPQQSTRAVVFVVTFCLGTGMVVEYGVFSPLPLLAGTTWQLTYADHPLSSLPVPFSPALLSSPSSLSSPYSHPHSRFRPHP